MQTEAHIHCIQSRSILSCDFNYPQDALHIWAENEPVNEYNVRGRPFYFGRGGSDFEKKTILQANMPENKFRAQDQSPPKKIHARTVGWKKKSGKTFPVLTQLIFVSANC